MTAVVGGTTARTAATPPAISQAGSGSSVTWRRWRQRTARRTTPTTAMTSTATRAKRSAIRMASAVPPVTSSGFGPDGAGHAPGERVQDEDGDGDAGDGHHGPQPAIRPPRRREQRQEDEGGQDAAAEQPRPRGRLGQRVPARGGTARRWRRRRTPWRAPSPGPWSRRRGTARRAGGGPGAPPARRRRAGRPGPGSSSASSHQFPSGSGPSFASRSAITIAATITTTARAAATHGRGRVTPPAGSSAPCAPRATGVPLSRRLGRCYGGPRPRCTGPRSRVGPGHDRDTGRWLKDAANGCTLVRCWRSRPP